MKTLQILTMMLATLAVAVGDTNVTIIPGKQETGERVTPPARPIQPADLTKMRIERPLEKALSDVNKSPTQSDTLATGSRQPERADVGKRIIEFDLESAIASAGEDSVPDTALAESDLPKLAIEAPVEQILSSGPHRPDNPHVLPGLVNWHADFESACRASEHSGKPVLLFHLLGQLDQEFT